MPLPDAVAALVVCGNRILLICRGESGPHPGIWAPPSGKVEPGESIEEAVVREVREEVGLEVRVVRTIGSSVSTGGTHLLHWCVVEAGDQELRLSRREASDARWVTADELDSIHPRFEGDVPYLRAALRRG